jgi:hypothetical protein
MTIAGLDLALVWIAVVAALVFPIRYWIGARWWRSSFGWLLMSLALILNLRYIPTIISLMTGVHLKATPPNVAINAVVAAWIVAADIIIDHLIRKEQRKADAVEREQERIND